jgi:glycosyltransferase involved in cell wall biosynthesis
LDQRLAELGYNSYRGGNPATFFVHVPNDRKRDVNSWYNVMVAIEDGRLYGGQLGKVDLVGGEGDWLPKRSEDCVLVVRGRNVPVSKLRRCFDSLARQTDQHWGLLVIDAGSNNGMEEYVNTVVRMRYGSRFTLYRNLSPKPPIANMDFAIRQLCDNTNSIIAMPDADDAFICDDAIAYLKLAYVHGADLAIGGLMRTDKEAKYPANFREPRRNRGGNVWQPLRTFRKYLFDRISPEDLKVDGEWVPHTEDWAFMLPIAEMATAPVQFERTFYLYEPSPLKQSLAKDEREALVAKIVSKPSYGGS